jgi:hypothetical protein
MADKVVEITLRVDSQFVRLLNANVGLSGGIIPDGPQDPRSVLARVVLAEACGAHAEQTALIIPPEWRGNIDIVPERRKVYEGGWSEVRS